MSYIKSEAPRPLPKRKAVTLILPLAAFLCATAFYMSGFIGPNWLLQYGITAFGYYTPVLAVGLWTSCTPDGCSSMNEPSYYGMVSNNFRAVQAFEILSIIIIFLALAAHILRILTKNQPQKFFHYITILLQTSAGVFVLVGSIACGIINNISSYPLPPNMVYGESMALATFGGFLLIITGLTMYVIMPVEGISSIRKAFVEGIQRQDFRTGGFIKSPMQHWLGEDSSQQQLSSGSLNVSEPTQSGLRNAAFI